MSSCNLSYIPSAQNLAGICSANKLISLSCSNFKCEPLSYCHLAACPVNEILNNNVKINLRIVGISLPSDFFFFLLPCVYVSVWNVYKLSSL